MKVGKTGKIVGASAIVVTAMALSGGSYWMGSRFEEEFRKNVEWFAAKGVPVSVIDYQRSIFWATARIDWASPAGTVSFFHNIRHGPLPALTAAARMHTEVKLSESEDDSTQTKENPGADPSKGKAPLAFDTVFGWGGGYHSRIAFPRIEVVSKEDQTKISWDGLNAEVSVSSNQTHKKADIVIDNLSIMKSDEDIFQVGRATLKSDMTRAKGFTHVYTGETSVALDKFFVRGKDPNGAVRGIAFENFRATGDVSVKDGAVAAGVKFDVKEITAEGDEKENVDHFELAFLAENIDVEAYDAILQVMQKNLNDQEDQEDGGEDKGQQAMTAVLQEQSKVLLQRKPVFSIKDVNVHWPEGAVTGNFRIAYVGDGDPDTVSLSSLAGDLQLTLPRALVVRFLSSIASEGIADSLEGGEENEVNIREETKEQVDKQMAQMLSNGIFAEKGDTLSVDAQLRDGGLNLNGKPQPLETLLGLIPF